MAEYVTIGGRKYCPCSVAMLDMAQAGFRAAGIIPARASIYDYVTQAGYRAGATAASRGSHDRGGTVDVVFSLVNTDAKQRLWDAAGAVACRRRSWEFTSTDTPDHGHLLVVGCPHLAKLAAEQLAEIRAGGDGMAGTRPWVGPRPSFVSWQTRHDAFTQQEDIMPLTQTDIDAIASRVWSATFGAETAGQRLARAADSAASAADRTRPITRGGDEVPMRQEIADAKTLLLAQAGALAGLRETVAQLAAGDGVDMDAITAAAEAGVLAGLAGARVTIDLGPLA